MTEAQVVSEKKKLGRPPTGKARRDYQVTIWVTKFEKDAIEAAIAAAGHADTRSTWLRDRMLTGLGELPGQTPSLSASSANGPMGMDDPPTGHGQVTITPEPSRM